MRKNLKMVLPVVGLVAVMLCWFAVPAAAAKIVLRTSEHDVTHPPLEWGPICGVDGPNWLIVTLKEYHYTLWDNGHFLVQTVYGYDFFDDAGNLIAHEQWTIRGVAGSGGLPYTFETNEQIECTGESATPGLLVLYHFGWTIGEDGFFKEIHLVVKP